MRHGNETARRCSHNARASVHDRRDAAIIAQAEHRAGVIIGMAFGLMFMIGIMGGF